MGYHISTNHIHVSNTEWIQKVAIIYVFVYINVAVISKEKEQQIRKRVGDVRRAEGRGGMERVMQIQYTCMKF